MAKRYVHIAFLFFALTALSGTWMRAISFTTASLPYMNVLHAHSHLAMLGWAFLGAFIVFIYVNPPAHKRKKEAMAICFALSITTFMMFLAFLWQGYGALSIIMSTVHIFIEYWAASFMYRQLKSQTTPRSISLFISAALISLILSSMGPFALGYLSASGLKDAAVFDMAIYFYLHFQYNGWLPLLLIGLFYMMLYKKNIPFNKKLMGSGFWLYVIALIPGYFLSVQWVDVLGDATTFLAAAGGVAQWAGVIVIVSSFKISWGKLTHHFSALTIKCLVITVCLLIIKSTMEIGLIHPALADLVYDSRSVIIGYLHLTLLGFISIFILTQFQMVHILRANQITTAGFNILLIGFVLNELLLFSQALIGWIGLAPIPFYMEGLLAASIVLTMGVFIYWVSYTTNSKAGRLD